MGIHRHPKAHFVIFISTMSYHINDKNMSNQNQKQNQNQIENQTNLNQTTGTATSNVEYIAPETLAFDAWVNDTAGDFMRLPSSDGGTIVAKFSKDTAKRKLVRRSFTDKRTGETRDSIRAEYMVVDPVNGDHSEKKLEVPKTLASQIEKNLSRNHTILEITRNGTGLNTRYMVVAV